MSGEKFYEILQQLDDDLIAEADPAVQKIAKPARWQKWLPVAAAVVLVAAIWRLGDGVLFSSDSQESMPASQATEAAMDGAAQEQVSGSEAEASILAAELPTLPVAPILPEGGGEISIGYRSSEDIPVYDFRPALANTTTLPVYRYPGGMVDEWHLNADETAMRNKAEAMAREFGIDPDTMEYDPRRFPVGDKETGTTEDETYTMYVNLIREDALISVGPELNAGFSIRFDGPMSPEDVAWGQSEEGNREEGDLLAALLKDRYGWKNPKPVITETTVNFNGDTHYQMFVYESDPDPVQDFLNYRLKTATAGFSREGELEVLNLNTWEGFEFAGDYPVRTEQEAKDALLAGDHLSGSDPAFPGEEFIAKTDLVYATNHTDVLMPYYVFYVEMPNERHLDLDRSTTEEEVYHEDVTVYRTFYVPAIRSDYLEELPVRDMQLNQ